MAELLATIHPLVQSGKIIIQTGLAPFLIWCRSERLCCSASRTLALQLCHGMRENFSAHVRLAGRHGLRKGTLKYMASVKSTDEEHSVSRRFPSVEELMEIHQVFDMLIEQLGNSAYCAVNSFESLCDLAIHALTDVRPSKGTYFEQCLADVRKDLLEEHPSESV